MALTAFGEIPDYLLGPEEVARLSAMQPPAPVAAPPVAADPTALAVTPPAADPYAVAPPTSKSGMVVDNFPDQQAALQAHEWSPYGVFNPDVAAAAPGMIGPGGFQTPEEYYAWHAKTFGEKEGRRGIPGAAPPVALDPFAQSMADARAATGDLAVRPPDAYAPTAVNGVPLPFNVPITQPLPQGVMEPELRPADDRYGTPYYAAMTNSGDFSGAVMAAPGQKIRLVDGKTGEVVYEGEGPEAARVATAVANSISEDKGRKAIWAIQGETGDGWVTQAQDMKDPKNGLLGTLADIALPIIGAMLMPVTGGMSAALAAGLGAAGGSALSSVAQGRSLEDALLRAAVSGVGAGVIGPAVGRAPTPAIGSTASQAASGVTRDITGRVVENIGSTLLPDLTPGLVSEVVARGATSALPGLIGAGTGALAGGLGVDALTGGAGTDTLAVAPPTDVDEVVILARQPGMTLEKLVGMGIPVGLANAALDLVHPPVSELVVEPVSPQRPPVVPLDTLVPQLNPPGLVSVAPPVIAPPTLIDQAVGAVTNNPLQAAGLALTLAPLLAGAGGGGNYPIPAGTSAAGTRGTLSPTYTAQLPGATLGGGTMGGRTPRAVDIDNRYAIERPEASFFSTVPQSSAQPFAVPSPSSLRDAGVGDINGDGRIDDLDLELFRARFGKRGYAHGGGVDGPGGGRDDAIDARLSDGEYVIDAETVALLGDGSSKAGARRLDDFRVKVRKHKGRSLAKGDFSVKAKDPHAYLAGGRA